MNVKLNLARIWIGSAICLIGPLAMAAERASIRGTGQLGKKTNAGQVEIQQILPERVVRSNVRPEAPKSPSTHPEFVHTVSEFGASEIPIDLGSEEIDESGGEREFEDPNLGEVEYTPGDSNGDGRVSYRDTDCFVSAMLGEEAWQSCSGLAAGYLELNDLNKDSSVTFDDIDVLLGMLEAGIPHDWD